MNAPISPPRLMTTEEFLALPDDGVERWLIDGQLREKRPRNQEDRFHNRHHSKVEACIGYWLRHWLRRQPPPRGEVLSGGVGCLLRREENTIVGIDVVYISAELAAQQPTDTTLLDGVPMLAVEIISPSDSMDEIDEKLTDYLEAGVQFIWIVNPYQRTVTVYRPDAEPEMFNVTRELSGEPHLPGFTVRVVEFFE